jgi:methyl-accepting chemotaxis protein
MSIVFVTNAFGFFNDGTTLAQTGNPQDLDKFINLGPWALLAVLLINKIIEAINKRKEDNDVMKMLSENKNFYSDKIKDLNEVVNETYDKINSLYEWHNKDDSEGVKIWYVKRSFKDSIDSLIETVKKQSEIIVHLNEIIERMSTIIKERLKKE